MVKNKSFADPESIAYFGAKAFVDGSFHIALNGRSKGMGFRFQHIDFQTVFSLMNACAFVRPILNPNAEISGQTMLLVIAAYRAYTSGKWTYGHWNGGNGEHETDRLRRIPEALRP